MKDPVQIQVENSGRQGEETGHSSSESSRQIDPTQIESNSRFKSDREKANPLSQLTFSYAIPMALKGIFRKKKPLTEEDLVTIPWRYRPDVISNRIAHYLEEGGQKKPKKKLNVPLAVLKAIKWSLFRITFFQTIFVCTRLFSVWVVKKLVETYVDINASEGEAYGWACVLTGCLVLGYLVEHHWSCPAHYYPTLVQNALVDLLYKKITRLSSYSLTQISAGRLMNLAVNDLTFLDNYAMYLPSIFTGVVAVIVGSVVIWQSFGVFTLIGIGYTVAWWPLQEGAIVMGTKVKGETEDLTNQRVKTTTETVEGIKLLKMYNWEMKFKEKIENIRTKELKLLKKTAIGQAISRAIAFSTVNCGTFLMFLAFVYTGHTLTIEGTMSAYLAFGYLRLFSSYFVGAALIFIEEARVVFKSLGKVLEAPEIGDVKFEEPTDRDNSVEFENFTAYWQTDDPNNAPESLKGKNKNKKKNNKEGKKHKKGHEQKLVHHEINPVLNEINLTLKKGSINALVGIVGSGKTSFLMAFTGEMPKTTGSLRYKGKIAYVEQEPTIFAGTFKENVLFGKPYDEKRYKEAVKACNLQSDLKLFDKGDESEITGGGNNLSGGQKARLAFARAVYADADIYLLDDPLSAVDPKVARSLYKNAIEGVLKGKTIILVTHQVDFVKNCENIIVMEKGKVLGSGTLEELREKGVHPEKIFGADPEKDAHNQMFDMHSVHSERDGSSMRHSAVSKSSLEEKEKRYGGHQEVKKDHANIEIGETKVEGKDAKAPKEDKEKTDKKPKEQEESKDKKAQATNTGIKQQEGTKKDHVNMEIDETKKAEGKDFDDEEEEDKAIVSGQNVAGQVTLKTYWNYIKEMGGIPFLILLVIVLVCLQFTIIAYVRLLGNWIAQTWPNWKIAAILGGLAGFDIFISNLMFLVLSLALLKASKRYHQKMLDRIIGAKTLFFDSNSVGSIVDRFSKDIGTIDRFIPLCVTDILNILSYYFTIVIASGIIKPVLLPLLLGAGALSIVFLVLCYPSIQQCRLFEHRTKAPAVSLLNETLSGVVIMRVYSQSENFHKRFKDHLHRSTKGNFNFVLASRVAGFYTDLVYIAAVIGSIFIITASSAKVSSGIAESFYAAFVLALTLSITGLLPHGLRQFSAVNISMASVARIQEYCNIPQEPPLEMPSDAEKLENGWPRKGEIEMHNVNMKYRPDKNLVIKDLDLEVKPGEKIGCVGRTGAGKSSIVQLLYRMREIYRKDNGSKESYVKIDGVDTQSVGLHLLRGNISMIPQTPYIFSETVRTNIDPLGKFSDEEIWRVLEDVRLKEHIENQPGKLDAKISSRSDIFSVGQKQLVCLARVILKPSPVLIMDEATANMDYETDNFLQEKINERFADSTRITIAHRLTTIASYDRVLVLSKGKRVQYDEPYKMLVKNVGDEELSNMAGHFASMVQNTGPISSKQIFKIAKEAYFERHGDGDEGEQKDKNEQNELEHKTEQ